MSVDILIFDPAAVSDADFPAWWEEQSEWSEDHSDPNPAVTTPELQAFYADICELLALLGRCSELGPQ